MIYVNFQIVSFNAENSLSLSNNNFLWLLVSDKDWSFNFSFTGFKGEEFFLKRWVLPIMGTSSELC